MSKEQIVDELMELDARLSGLCDSIEFVNRQTLEGIREQDTKVLIGTIDTLEHIARIYHARYNALSSNIIDFIREVDKNE